MDYIDFMVDRAQHMRPLEYDLSENYNELVRYLHDMGVLDNVPVATLGPGEILSASYALAAPLRSLVVYGNSTQAGTPTPDAPVPILSVDDLSLNVCGKNLCPTADGTTIINEWVREGANYVMYLGVYVDNATLTLSCEMTGAPATSSNNRLYVTIQGAQSKFCDLNSSGSKSVTVTGSGYVRMSLNANGANSVQSLLKNIQLEVGSTATAYEPYQDTTVPDLLPEGTSLRSLPDGTKDELRLSYLRPSTRAGRAVYSRTLTALIGETTTAATDGITGTVGVDVMSTTGEIADGPTVLYKLATPVITTLDPIELPQLPAPNATVWCDGGSATPQLTAEYIRNLSASISDIQASIADIISG